MLIIFAAIDNTDKSFPTLAGHPVGLSRMGFSPERKGQAELVRRKAGTVSQKGCSLIQVIRASVSSSAKGQGDNLTSIRPATQVSQLFCDLGQVFSLKACFLISKMTRSSWMTSRIVSFSGFYTIPVTCSLTALTSSMLSVPLPDANHHVAFPVMASEPARHGLWLLSPLSGFSMAGSQTKPSDSWAEETAGPSGGL